MYVRHNADNDAGALYRRNRVQNYKKFATYANIAPFPKLISQLSLPVNGFIARQYIQSGRKLINEEEAPRPISRPPHIRFT